MRNRIVYYFFIIPISHLPLSVLHGLSSFLYIWLYFLLGYRKKIVRENIEKSLIHLPKKSQRKIERQFYQHLCDLVFESLKNFTISEHKVRERMIFENPELVNAFFDKGQDAIIVGGHYNSWELYALAMPLRHKHRGVGIYRPIHNKYFDHKMRLSREKYGLKMIPIKETAMYFEEDKAKPDAFIFATDQVPNNPQNAYWMQFLNQDTGVQFGAEKYAKQYNLPVISGQIKKIKRGYYKIRYELLFDNPKNLEYGEVTQKHTKELEKIILDKPQYWLWSHRRWKRKRPESGLKQDELTTNR